VITRVGVVVPAHDEEELIAGCLNGLRSAADGASVNVDVVVVLDACSDGTADLAAECGFETIAISARNVGAARRTGFELLLSRHDPRGLWLATTDADSVVPSDWITRQLRHAAAGADAVVGTVRVADWSGWPPGVAEAFDGRYVEEPGHRHIHGANLGCAATAYLVAQGLRDLELAEDVDLVRALESSGYHVTWAADLAVTTSARSRSRVTGGFADYLGALADGLVA
jgi:glycosyltransferase involved in cell wall biosynthesis